MPRRLTTYIARSARASSSSTVGVGSTRSTRATPMLASTDTSRLPQGEGRAEALEQRPRNLAWGPAGPPAAPRTRLRRTARACRHRTAPRGSASRPPSGGRRLRCAPTWSLTALKPSRSRKQMASGRRSRRCSSRAWVTRSTNRARFASPVSWSWNAWWRSSASRSARARASSWLSRTVRNWRSSTRSTITTASTVSTPETGCRLAICQANKAMAPPRGT